MGGLKEIKKVLVEVTPLEAAVLMKLREFEYGEMTIKKKEGKPYQIVKGGTEILDERLGLNLEGAVVIPPGTDLVGMLSKLSDKEYGRSEGAGSRKPAYGNERE